MHGDAGLADPGHTRPQLHDRRRTVRAAAWVLALALAVVAFRLLLGGSGAVATGLAALAALVAAICPIPPLRRGTLAGATQPCPAPEGPGRDQKAGELAR